MPIFTKDGKILVVEGGIAANEACCCDGDVLFHVSPESLTPVEATTDFDDVSEPLSDRYREWKSPSTAVVTKLEGSVYVSTDPGAATTVAVGICPNLENVFETWCSSSDDFYVRMDFENLSLTDINFATYRFGIHFSAEPRPTMNTDYWIGREINDSEHKVSWQSFSDSNRTTVGNITQGYFEAERISGAMALKLNGVTYSSTGYSGSFGAPWFGFKSYWNPGTVGSANITSAVIRKNGETEWVLQKRWLDVVTPGTNDAIAAGVALYRTKYIEDMKNYYDGVSMGGYNSFGNYRYMNTALQLPAETLCFHVVADILVDQEFFGDQGVGAGRVDVFRGKLRLSYATQGISTISSYSGWKVITYRSSATATKIYVNGVSVALDGTTIPIAAWTDIRLGDWRDQTDIAEMKVTGSMSAAAIIKLHADLMDKYDIT